MDVWFDDPKQLIRSDKVAHFWPTSSQTPEDRVNASSRFIIYMTSVLYLIRRDIRMFVLGGTLLAVLYLMYRSDMIKSMARTANGSDNDQTTCSMPTRDNPMGNAMLHHYQEEPNRPSACWAPSVEPFREHFLDNTFGYDAGRSRTPLPEYQRRHASRQWVPMPVSSLPGGEQTAFAEWAWGAKHGDHLCRVNPKACSPDARGVQLEAFGGLDSSGGPRTGMHGGTPHSG